MKGYFWIPAVHERFGEQGVVYFVQLAVPFARSVEDIELMAKPSVLSSYRIYALYGRYDFAVVVWGTSDKLRNFTQALKGDSNVAAVEEHIVKQQTFPDLGRVSEREIERTHMHEIVSQSLCFAQFLLLIVLTGSEIHKNIRKMENYWKAVFEGKWIALSMQRNSFCDRGLQNRSA